MVYRIKIIYGSGVDGEPTAFLGDRAVWYGLLSHSEPCRYTVQVLTVSVAVLPEA